MDEYKVAHLDGNPRLSDTRHNPPSTDLGSFLWNSAAGEETRDGAGGRRRTGGCRTTRSLCGGEGRGQRWGGAASVSRRVHEGCRLGQSSRAVESHTASAASPGRGRCGYFRGPTGVPFVPHSSSQVQALGSRGQDLGSRVQNPGSSVKGLQFRVGNQCVDCSA
jgi:hypothetical protein